MEEKITISRKKIYIIGVVLALVVISAVVYFVVLPGWETAIRLDTTNNVIQNIQLAIEQNGGPISVGDTGLICTVQVPE